jgi:MFS family permease
MSFFMPRSRIPLIGCLASGAFSNFGNATSAIVYPWLMYDLTGSAAAMGLVAFFTLSPVVLGAFIGSVVVDRFGVRRVALLADGLSAGTAVALAALHANGLLSLEIVLILAVIGAIMDGPGTVAHDARIPELARIARTPLMRVNVIDDFFDNGAQLSGPVIAGLTLSIGGTAIGLFAVASVSLIAAAFTWFTLPPFRARVFTMTWTGIFEGPRYILATPILRNSVTLAGIGMAVFIALESVALPAVLRSAGRPATDLSLFLGASAIGAVLINVLLLMLHALPSTRTAFAVTFAGFTISLVLLVADRSPVCLGISGLLLGLSAGPLTPLVQTLLQTLPPKAIRARVLGSALCLITIAAPVCALIAGVAVDRMGATATFSGAAVICAVAFIAATTILDGQLRPDRLD